MLLPLQSIFFSVLMTAQEITELICAFQLYVLPTEFKATESRRSLEPAQVFLCHVSGGP